MRTPLFSRAKRWVSLAAGMLLSSVLLAACGENAPSTLDTHGFVANSEGVVFWAILIIATIVFVGVEGALIYSIFRYRERPGAPRPRQIHGNLKIEIVWTVIPMVILFVVLFFTIRGLFEVAPQAEPKTGQVVRVEAVGHQWWWEFYYEDYKFTTADTMHIPAGATIHVDLYTNNVIHSFWVPQLTGKTDLIPGHKNTKWFNADPTAVGKTFTGICAEYCGTQHGNMRFTVVVDDQNSFQTWVSAQQQAAVTPAAGSLAEQGAKLFANQCASCHGIVGVNMKPNANGAGQFGYIDPAQSCDDPKAQCLVGPDLTHFGSRNLIAGGVLESTNNVAWKDDPKCKPDNPNLFQECNLAKWLKDPEGVKPGNDMAGATASLTNDQIRQLVAYLESLT
ncbi:MAG: cytochrome c oxidase subunit II [Ktedonobacteraceae bacterium]|nr:cytochrome c oxidase subunit II [Ktedonobacteraceae bacterium]